MNYVVLVHSNVMHWYFVPCISRAGVEDVVSVLPRGTKYTIYEKSDFDPMDGATQQYEKRHRRMGEQFNKSS